MIQSFYERQSARTLFATRWQETRLTVQGWHLACSHHPISVSGKPALQSQNPVWRVQSAKRSKITKVLEHSCKIATKGIALLIGIINIGPNRIKMLEDNGFGITHFHICNVKGWFGKSLFLIAQKGKPSIITYDISYWKMPKDENDEYTNKQKEYQHKYYVKNFKDKMMKYRANRNKKKIEKKTKKKLNHSKSFRSKKH